MGKIFKRRPEVERLESMTLLSGMAAAAHSAAIPNPLHLTGSVHGTYQLEGTGSTSKASGSISPLGHITDSGSVSHIDGLGTVTMTAKQGKVFLDLKLRPSGIGFGGTYTITGGTKAFAAETGSGHVQITPSGSVSHGHLMVTYS